VITGMAGAAYGDSPVLRTRTFADQEGRAFRRPVARRREPGARLGRPRVGTFPGMTTPPQEPLNAAAADPTTQPEDSSDSHRTHTAQDAPVSAQVTDEGDLPDKVEDDEVEVGLGPEG
jgi:hypothetical protein